MKSKISGIILSFLILGILLSGVYLFIENRGFSDKVDILNKEIILLKRRSDKKDLEYAKSIDSVSKLIDDTAYTINGKKLTTGSIVKASNQWFNEKEKFRIERDFYKKNYEELVSKYNKEIQSSTSDKRELISSYETLQKYPPSKFREYEFFFQQLKKNYGISYAVKPLTDSTRELSIVGGAKLDSALYFFKQYKDGKLKININISPKQKNKKDDNPR